MRGIRFYSTASVSRSTFPLLGQHALITGGATGIGFGIAKKLASQGCKITMISRNEQNLESKAIELNNQTNLLGISHQFIACDLREHKNIEDMFKSKKDLLLDANILVNNSGLSQGSLLSRTTDAAISSIVNLNLTVPMLMTKYFTNLLISTRSKRLRELKNSFVNETQTSATDFISTNQGNLAHVINISSVLANVPVTGAVVYSASKSGLIGFTKSFAHEMGPKGIRCNAILPGLVADTQIGKTVNLDLMQSKEVLKESPKSGITVEDVAEACYYLVSTSKITGQCLTIDNGISVA